MLDAGKITFNGSQGYPLAARLGLPEGQPLAYVLFAHCFTCTKDIVAASRIAKALQKSGCAVLRFDFTGLGQSDGDFANTNFSSNVADLVAAADFMRAEALAPAVLVGHSLGGAAVLAAAHKIPEVKAVVTLGAPSDVAHVTHQFKHQRDAIMDKGEVEVQLVGRPFRIQKQFIEDVEGAKLEPYVRDLKKALLVMHAPLDKTVGIENAGQIFGWAKHPKSYISLDDADHLITQPKDAEYAGQLIACWAQKYI